MVRAFDRDLIFHDTLGYTSTNEEGGFEVRVGVERFRAFRDARLHLYPRIYDWLGVRLINETTHAIRWKASALERYRVAIPARALHEQTPRA